MNEMIMMGHSLNNNTRMGYMSLFKYTSFGQSASPRIASNFRHLLSCGTTVTVFRFSLFFKSSVLLHSLFISRAIFGLGVEPTIATSFFQ